MTSTSLSSEDLEASLAVSGLASWSWSLRERTLRGTTAFEALFGVPITASRRQVLEMVHPDDRARVLDGLRACVRTGAPITLRYRVQRDGRLSWHESRCAPRTGLDGSVERLVGTTQDVTRVQELEDQLEAAREVHQLLGELASDYVYAVDAKTLTPSVVAGSFERTTGYTPDEVRDQGGWYMVIHPDDRARVRAGEPLAFSGRPFINEYRIIDKSGQIRWLRDHGRALMGADGTPLRLVGGVSDVTERKRLEEQLYQASKMDALARLAGGVAHDFNNLLTIILASTAWLRLDRGDRKDRTAALDDIVQASERAAELTRQLLLFGRRQHTSPESLDVVATLRSGEGLLRRSLPERIALDLELGSTPLTARIDPSNLQLLTLNLVVNARDAMPEGGRIRVEVRPRHFAVTDPHRPPEFAAGDAVLIEVKDSGVGIPPDVRARLFEPFFTTKPSGKGTGLGLATVHGIVALARGAITVESEPGKGTTFRIILPRSAEGAATVEPDRVLVTGGSERVLIVEDEPAVRAVAFKALKEHGYRVNGCASAEEALVSCAETKFDLLLTDVRLPGMSGVELARHLLERHPALKVLLMSGDVGTHDTSGLRLLEKPFTTEGLVRRVREIIDT